MTTKTILETFYSIQGEGLKIGVPSVFIRFPGCNLRCPWCDTKYSWEEEPRYSIEDVSTLIKTYYPSDIVITGGEPLLTQDTILNIIEKHPSLNYTIETNGTIFPNETLRAKNIFWSVSPKLFFNDWYKSVRKYNNLNNVQFKFVITDLNPDLDKISHLCVKHPIIVQPDGNRDNYSQACKELAEAVISRKLNYRVLPQFHKICWGNQRNI